MYVCELTTLGGPPRALIVGEPTAKGDFPVVHVPSGQNVAVKFSRADAETLCGELNCLVVPFDELTCCDSCYLGWELIDDDGKYETHAPCQKCGGEIALVHLINEAVRLRISGAVL